MTRQEQSLQGKAFLFFISVTQVTGNFILPVSVGKFKFDFTHQNLQNVVERRFYRSEQGFSTK